MKFGRCWVSEVANASVAERTAAATTAFTKRGVLDDFGDISQDFLRKQRQHENMRLRIYCSSDKGMLLRVWKRRTNWPPKWWWYYWALYIVVGPRAQCCRCVVPT